MALECSKRLHQLAWQPRCLPRAPSPNDDDDDLSNQSGDESDTEEREEVARHPSGRVRPGRVIAVCAGSKDTDPVHAVVLGDDGEVVESLVLSHGAVSTGKHHPHMEMLKQKDLSTLVTFFATQRAEMVVVGTAAPFCQRLLASINEAQSVGDPVSYSRTKCALTFSWVGYGVSNVGCGSQIDSLYHIKEDVIRKARELDVTDVDRLRNMDLDKLKAVDSYEVCL